MQLELSYTDGSHELVASDAEWKTFRAPIVSSEIYDGEYYDARREQSGWSTTGYDVSSWEPAFIAPKPRAVLAAQISPPIRRKEVLSASAITEPRPGVFVFDFGQNFAG